MLKYLFFILVPLVSGIVYTSYTSVSAREGATDQQYWTSRVGGKGGYRVYQFYDRQGRYCVLVGGSGIDCDWRTDSVGHLEIPHE